MADESSEVSTDRSESSSEPATVPNKAPMAKTASSQVKPAHPKVAEMVIEAIVELAERGGSSLIAIKRYISEKYDLDAEKQATFIKKYLKKAVADGILVQPKGRGASGSFKLPAGTASAIRRKEKKAAKANAVANMAAKKSSKKANSEKVTSPTRNPTSTKTGETALIAEKKSKPAKAASAKTGPRSPKAKKASKSPMNKPKAPRPKKVPTAPKSPKPPAKKMVTAKK